MTTEIKLIKAIEDYFAVKYDRFIANGNNHEEAINLATKAVYEAADSVALKKVVRAVMYARYGNKNQLDGKGENK